MLSRDRVRALRERLLAHSAPMLSLYASVDPSRAENARGAWRVRVSNALDDLDLPGGLAERVRALLQEERPAARTLALFAGGEDDLLERLDLLVELPALDLAGGRAEARYGEPFLAPLHWALDEHERAGVLHVERTSWRFYEVFLGEIEETTDAFRAVAPEKWRELEAAAATLERGWFRAHAETHPDRFQQRVETRVHVFLRRLAQIVEDVVVRRGIERVVLFGPDVEAHFLENALPKAIRNRIVARLGDLPAHGASGAQVLEHVAPALEAAERGHEHALLDEVREESRVWGLAPTLEALQLGRLSVLIAPWALDAKVWRAAGGGLGATREQARLHGRGGEGEPAEAPLRDWIGEACASVGTRLEFVRGRPEDRLHGAFGGLAGIRRW